MALSTSRTSTERGRPPRLAGRISGAISAHSASVTSLGYRRPRRSAVARCSGFHIRHLASTQVPRTESQPTPETQLLSGSALIVRSRDEVVGVDPEWGGVFGPGVADRLEGCSPSQRFEVLGEVVGCDKGLKVP